MKSIPSLKRGTSLSLIISHKAFVTVVFKLGNCFAIISSLRILQRAFENYYKEVQSWQNVQFVEKALISVTM
jgi:hypothetical protein